LPRQRHRTINDVLEEIAQLRRLGHGDGALAKLHALVEVPGEVVAVRLLLLRLTTQAAVGVAGLLSRPLGGLFQLLRFLAALGGAAADRETGRRAVNAAGVGDGSQGGEELGL